MRWRDIRAALAVAICLAAAPATAGDLQATWVTPDMVALERVLPPPPEPGLPEGRADLAAVEAAVAARSKADEARIDAEKPCTPLAFAGDILGPGFTAAKLPLTFALVQRAFEDTELAVLASKKAIARARPYTLEPKLATYGHRSQSASYPSGHAACGRVMAVILAAMVPGKARALYERADLYGRNRELAGTHFPSDLAAGGTAGTVVAAALFRDPHFRTAFARAAAEARAVVK